MKIKEKLQTLSELLWDAAPKGMSSPTPELFEEFWKFEPTLSACVVEEFETRFGIHPVIKDIRVHLDDPQFSDCFSVTYQLGFIEDVKSKISCDCVIDHSRALLTVEHGRDSNDERIRKVSEAIISQYVGSVFKANL